MERGHNGRHTPTRNGAGPSTDGSPRAKQRAYLIAAMDTGDDLSELRELLRTAGVAVVGQAVQHRDKPHPNTYLGPGKLQEVKVAATAADANVVVCDDELSPRQERNLEKELGISVVDRTATILDIFAAHANTAEGKLQVELAQLEYNLARMRGLWTHLERLGGVSSGGRAACLAAASRPAVPASRRSRPTAGWPATGSPPCAAAWSTSRARARSSAPSASAPTCPRSRWPATPTPASPRCSTR